MDLYGLLTNWNFFDRTKRSKDIDHMALDGLSSQLSLVIYLAKINLRDQKRLV